MAGSDGQGRAPPNPLARPQDAAPGGVGGLTQPRLRPLTQPLTRRPYRQRPESEWLEIERLFVNGATAKALAERFGGCERRIYERMSKRGLSRRRQKAGPLPVVDQAGREAALDLSVTTGGEDGAAEAPCRALSEGASLGEAAAAAAQTAINKVRALDPARAYTWARLAGTLERLARAGGGETAGLGDSPTEAGRRAALDFLRREGVTTVWWPDADDDTEPDKTGASAAPAPHG